MTDAGSGGQALRKSQGRGGHGRRPNGLFSAHEAMINGRTLRAALNVTDRDCQVGLTVGQTVQNE